jgi:acyl-CoA synthetase (AMP-forming)/AMP-acid ligase II
LFSSGTTGRPKGVLHSVNTLTAGAANMARITSAGQDTVCFLIAPLTSIAGLMQVHMTADCHGTLVLEDQFEPRETLRRMAAAGATLLGGAPVIAERLLHAAQPPTGTTTPGTPVTLRTLALGGAMLPRPLLELATDAFGIEIARVYGSTEAPNFTGSLPADAREARLSDDGALMPGSEVRVGSSGHPREGLLRGPGVFLCYLDPGDTAAAFEDGWYRSGDQVELSQGRLTVVGRLKEVVSRNGLKISLPESDAALEGLPGVLESSSFGMPDEETGERLAVAVQLADGASLSLDDVTGYLLRAGVARRKLPEQLVRWDGPLPRTASGKVIRSRLVMESPAKDSDLASRLHQEKIR